jgi:molybdate-binding protein/transcriptional regulator with XRE-family HTH domain
MSGDQPMTNRVRSRRQQRGWSQAELAERAGISRAAVSAVEIQRLVPSVAAALALATALDCRVEELFGPARADPEDAKWAWPPTCEPCRYWHARVAGRLLLFPAEAMASGIVAHDGVFRNGTPGATGPLRPDDTLVMASCDPAASLLANEYARAGGRRLLVLHRSSGHALKLLRDGLVDVAGVHLANAKARQRNSLAAQSILGTGYSLVTAGTWQEGLAVRPETQTPSIQSLLRRRLRWVGRESGGGARQCQDELLQDRPGPRRTATDHHGVAEAIRCGWADVGVCVRLACEDAGLRFLSIRTEAYDLCFRTEQEGDPRLRALVAVLRSRSFQQSLSQLPGYDCRASGETMRIE